MGIDCNEIGFRCGLEIHQQIGLQKLFCKCPSIKFDGMPNYRIKRYLRASAGETGEVDVAAKFEAEKKRYFLYEGHNANTCLVELDESPPFPVNGEALEIALKISLLLNARIVDEIRFMRKTVVDGSNTTGFQRTALVAYDGCIETSLGRVSIPTICLEEEAAQKTETRREYARYNLNRLGIALVEIATDSSIKNPEHAKEVAAYIGMVLRSVEGVKRGLGTIRQDVNVSIERGARTEIKGFQDLRTIPKVIEYEINRQLKLIEEDKKLKGEVRKVEPDFTTSFLRPLPGAARLYPETDVAPIKLEKQYIETLEKELPLLVSDKIDSLAEKYRISKGLAKDVMNSKNFESFVNKFKKIEPSAIAHILINVPKDIKSRLKLSTEKLKGKDFEEVLSYLNQGKIPREAVIDVLVKKVKNKKIDLKEFKTASDKDIEREIKKLVENKRNLSISAYMGILMGKYRGKVDGKKIMEILKKYVK